MQYLGLFRSAYENLVLISYAQRQFLSVHTRGGSSITGKGVHMYKGVGVRFAVFVVTCWERADLLALVCGV